MAQPSHYMTKGNAIDNLESLISELAEAELYKSFPIGFVAGQSTDAIANTRNSFERLIAHILVEDVACNEGLYDQQKYDEVFCIFHRIFSWTRVKFHQEVHERKSLIRKHPEYRSSKSIKELLLPQQKQLIVASIESVILHGITDLSFKQYLKDRLLLAMEGAI